jgi:protein-disulfide isomerase
VLAFTLLLIAPVGRPAPGGKDQVVDVPVGTASALATVGLLAVAIMIGLQMAFPAQTMRIENPFLPSAGRRGPAVTGPTAAGPEDIDTGPGPDRRITVLQRKFEFKPHEVPAYGSPDAPVVLVELFDYTCSHCRRIHNMFKEARKRYGGQFALLKMPTPLDSDCNPMVTKNKRRHENGCELARLAMAVWLADPGKFGAYEDYLFRNEVPPDLHAAKRVASARVGIEALEQALADPRTRQLLANGVQLYRETGNTAVPQFVYRAMRMSGGASTPQQLFEVLEKATPLRALP